MEPEPSCDVPDQSYRDRAFFAAQTIVDDPGNRGFPAAVFSADDVDPTRLERYDARSVACVFRPKDDFEDG